MERFDPDRGNVVRHRLPIRSLGTAATHLVTNPSIRLNVEPKPDRRPCDDPAQIVRQWRGDARTVDLTGMDASGIPQRPWPPTKYLDYEDTIATSMSPAKIWTDAGSAYVKPMADDVNPHSLAIELVCTRLAEWFGLRVLETCILHLGASDTFPRRSAKSPDGYLPDCKPGPAFCTRAVEATPWDGSGKSLSKIANRDDITRLVIFDTWTRNEDRFPPVDATGAIQSMRSQNLGNVLLVRDRPKSKSLRLVAMDFGHAFVKGRELPSGGFRVDADKDQWIYGLFPGFRPYVTPSLVDSAIIRLKRLDRRVVEGFVAEVPREWEVEAAARTALAEHLYRRRSYLADTIKARLAPMCYPQGMQPG